MLYVDETEVVEKTAQDDLLEQTPELSGTEGDEFVKYHHKELERLAGVVRGDADAAEKKQAAETMLAVLRSLYAFANKNDVGLLEFLQLHQTCLKDINQALGLPENKQHNPEVRRENIEQVTQVQKTAMQSLLDAAGEQE